jgi:hypothetical protein
MNGVIRQVTLEGDLVLHALPNGRWAIEVNGVDLSKLLAESCRVALNDEDGSAQWNIGKGQLAIVPGQLVNELRNPPAPKVRDATKPKRGRRGRANGR